MKTRISWWLPMVMLGFGPGCNSPTPSHPNPTDTAELAATTGSEGIVLLPDGRLSVWDYKGKKRWELDTNARPNEHRLVVAPNGLIYLRTDQELLGINGEGGKQFSLSIGSPPAGQFGGVVARMDSSALVVNPAGELVAVRPDGSIQWNCKVPKPIISVPVATYGSSTFVFGEHRLTSVSADGTIAW
jgi:hypothetical protein